MAARTELTALLARGGLATLAFGRRGGAGEVLDVFGDVFGIMGLGMLSGKAFLKMKSHQPIIRHGDRAYNAAGV
jgi:uncharacterized membrane protein YebE (DUF533 family)